MMVNLNKRLTRTDWERIGHTELAATMISNRFKISDPEGLPSPTFDNYRTGEMNTIIEYFENNCNSPFYLDFIVEEGSSKYYWVWYCYFADSKEASEMAAWVTLTKGGAK